MNKVTIKNEQNSWVIYTPNGSFHFTGTYFAEHLRKVHEKAGYEVVFISKIKTT